MFFRLGILLISIKAFVRKYFSFSIKKDRLAFSLHHRDEDNHIAQEYICRVPQRYILKSNQDSFFLSTAFPLFLWEGRNENRAYYLPRVPVIKKKFKHEFNLNNRCCSGSRITFTTNSGEICIQIQLNKIISTPNMPLSSLAGLDIFEIKNDGEHWIGCYAPKDIFHDKVYCTIVNKECSKRTYTMHLPLFSQVQLIQIGLDKNSIIFSPDIKRIRLPIAVYGSSITQGCASSRPSLSYAGRLARQMECDVLNFGFSGSARGEEELAEYIANINLSAIILEYDHNVSVEILKKTHYKFYSILRASQKRIPIIIFSRCSGGLSISKDEEQERFSIIRHTYNLAKNNGDAYIYLLRGEDFFKNKEECFVDDKHPNDIGMKIISEKLLEIFKQTENSHE